MRSILFLILLFIGNYAMAQSELLAKNYFDQGEYEKAIVIYEKLNTNNPGRLDFLFALVEANQQLENFEKAESLLKEKLSTHRNIPQIYVELGYNSSLQNKEEEAKQYYNQAISFVLDNPNYAYNIGHAFEQHSLLDEAIIVYERGMSLDAKKDFNAQLARIYGEQGNLDKMFAKYINMMENNPAYKSVSQRNFSMYITEDPNNDANVILRKALLTKLQENPAILYNELLSWLFIQQKEFKKAFTQEKAIFKRTEEDLTGITNLALITIAEKDYDNATEIITFVIENSSTPEAKLQGYQYLMKIALEKATPKDYETVEKQFEDLLTEYGMGVQTYLLQIDYNHFLAFKVGKVENAITNLKTLTQEKLTSYQEARVKMELADILVFDEKFNQALIYYSQIQNKVKSDVLAQEARFKVAQTSYFKGDFSWAQVQLDVLRKSASQLIANDAMQLSLMIRDNSLEDSTQTALKKYARADLLMLQNKNTEAITVLEDILTNHKGEKIEDEALLKQGELYERTKQFPKAESNYLKLIELYKEDILADDAHFKLAKLYENELQDPQKAKQLYEQIIFNYADSIYFVEARKKYRTLRGDAIN
jgi:tetratricopeptide (TPR) repeat protein